MRVAIVTNTSKGRRPSSRTGGGPQGVGRAGALAAALSLAGLLACNGILGIDEAKLNDGLTDGGAEDATARDGDDGAITLVDGSLDVSQADGNDGADGDEAADGALDAGDGDADGDVDVCAPLRRCGTVCIDTSTSDQHCGACGHSCAGGVCNAGRCEVVYLASQIVPPLAMDVGGMNVYYRLNTVTAHGVGRVSRSLTAAELDCRGADPSCYLLIPSAITGASDGGVPALPEATASDDSFYFVALSNRRIARFTKNTQSWDTLTASLSGSVSGMASTGSTLYWSLHAAAFLRFKETASPAASSTTAAEVTTGVVDGRAVAVVDRGVNKRWVLVGTAGGAGASPSILRVSQTQTQSCADGACETFASGTGVPRAIVVHGDWVYWASTVDDLSTDVSFYKMRYDGTCPGSTTCPVVLAAGIPQPAAFSLAVDDTHVYFGNGTTVRRLDVTTPCLVADGGTSDGGTLCGEQVLDGFDQVWDVGVDDTALYVAATLPGGGAAPGVVLKRAK